MIYTPGFPTTLHQQAAEAVRDYFAPIPAVDTVLLVNSCAGGQAVAESDLDFAILVKPNTALEDIRLIETKWLTDSKSNPAIQAFTNSSQFSHLHLDIIDGKYSPPVPETGVGPDFFEVEIGNQIRYSAPMLDAGHYFEALQNKWLPYYNDQLRADRLKIARDACAYDLNHIPSFLERGLHFQAFDILYKAFQEYLQALFIAHRIYPIAYNKWIKEQVVKWLNLPDLYPKLSTVLSVTNIESDEINVKAKILRALLEKLPGD